MMRRVLISIVLVCLLNIGFAYAKPSTDHPRHQVIVWTTRYKGTIFRVIKFPHCQHVETIFTNCPPGETRKQVKDRLGGFASSTACFYNRNTLLPVDFFRKSGKVYVGREVGRSVLAIREDGRLEITKDYDFLQSDATIDALALGSLISPFSLDGFTSDFANLITDRMSLAISPKYIYLVQANTSLWKMSQFVEVRLPCDMAINTDGGHSVK
ncbi:MAG: hypothetical protein U0946_01460, partial [Patescibacteria group bacterium]|nr:hypothetical protein [Patescibacteria group bacterium]